MADRKIKPTVDALINKLVVILSCGITALVFLLIFSDTTSPLFSEYHVGVDSIFYMQHGKRLLYQLTSGISTSGISPMTLIQAFGQFIYNGRPGAFIVQFIFFVSFIYLALKITKLRILKLPCKAIVLLVCLSFLAITFEGGNLQEEFALPLLALCLYLGLKDYIWNDSEDNPPLNALIFGFSFGFLIFLKVISVATLLAIILAISFDLILSKNIRNFLQNLFYGFLGLAAALTPLLIYGLLNDTLALIISRNFFSGITYVADSGSISLLERYHIFVFVPILLSIGSAYMERQNRRYLIFIASNTIIMTIALYAGRYYLHYATLNVLTLLVALAVILKEENIDFLYNYIAKNSLIKQFSVVLLVGIIVFSAISLRLINRQISMEPYIFNEYNIEKPFADIIDIIPAEEMDDVLAYDVSPAWYYVTDTIPYGDYMGYWMSYYSSINPDVKDIVDSIIASNPKWIIVKAGSSDSNIFLQEKLKSDFKKM